MNNCLNNLLALKSLCTTGTAPLFYLDDIEGVTQERLAQLATARDGSGKALASFLIESSVRLMLADIDSIIPANYRINNEITSVCSSCTFTGFYSNATTQGTGITVKNTSNSRFSSLIIDSLKVKVNTTGLFTLRIADTNGLVKDIEQEFVAGEVLNITGINFETTAKQLSIFFTNTTVQLFTISCPAGSGCGCGGSSTTAVPTDIIIAGYENGNESSVQNGVLPCVKLRCSYDDIICDLVQSSPRLFGLALLYLVASKIFDENANSQRVNRTASFNQDEKISESERYYLLYRERLTGNNKKSILGISQAVNQNLKNIKDKCVTCTNPVGIAWATG
jgi:hypothetical protein